MFLYKRPGSPYWQIGWYNPDLHKNGKPVSTKTKNRKEAELILKEYKKLKERERFERSHSKLIRNSLKLKEAYNLFLQDRANTGRKFSELTKTNYCNAFKHLEKIIPDKDISAYTKSDYHQFVNSMSRLQQNSLSVYTKCLYALFNWLVKEEYIRANPFKRVKEEQKELIIRTDQEVNKLIEHAAGTKFYWMVLFQLVSAFRITEVRMLKSEHIEKNIIRVKRKGSKYDYIPITSEMRELLLVLPMPNDKDKNIFPFSYHAAWRFYKSFRTKTGIQFHSHDCRKYCLSKLANSGVAINYTMHYAGHSNVSTTIKYYIRSDLKKIAAEINKKVKIISETVYNKGHTARKKAVNEG